MESREATVVTEEEMRAFYEANRELFVMPEKVRVRLILVRIDRESSASETAAAREKIGQAAAELRRGVDFAQVAQRYSEDVESRGNGGLLPPCPRGVRENSFDRTAFSLSAPGQISDMYLDKHGYQLLQLVQRSEPRQESFPRGARLARTAGRRREAANDQASHSDPLAAEILGDGF
jgi:peptidyl-prolyl cis-trans isomerase D